MYIYIYIKMYMYVHVVHINMYIYIYICIYVYTHIFMATNGYFDDLSGWWLGKLFFGFPETVCNFSISGIAPTRSEWIRIG